MTDPFQPLSAKPPSDADRIKQRIKEGASHGGKTHRGKPKPRKFLYGYKAKEKTP